MPEVIIKDGLTNEDTLAKIKKTLTWLLANLDHENVRRLYTEYCQISSAEGETQISGPLLLMYDKQGVPVLRVKMGYDKDTNDFVHQLMNASGNITYSVDSNGDLIVERGTFKGKITIGTGNDIIKADPASGFWIGHADFASAPFKVTKEGAAEATNLTITGGNISVDTDLHVGNNIFLGDMTANDKNIVLYSNGSNLCYLSFDADNKLTLNNWGTIEVNAAGPLLLEGTSVDIDGGQVAISSSSGGVMQISKVGPENLFLSHSGGGDIKLGHIGSGDIWLQQAGTGVLKIESEDNMSITAGGYVFAEGVWRFSTNTPYIGSAEAGNEILKKSEIETLIPSISGTSGSFTTVDGKTVTVSNGLVTSIL